MVNLEIALRQGQSDGQSFFRVERLSSLTNNTITRDGVPADIGARTAVVS